MKYLCLIYQDESIRQKLPKAEFEKIHGEYLALTDDLKTPAACSEITGFNPPRRRLQSGYETERLRLPMAHSRRRRSNSAATT